MKKRKGVLNKKIILTTLILVAAIIVGYIYFLKNPASADLTGEVKKSIGMDQARFQINPVSSWNAPVQITFRVAAARWMFVGMGSNGQGGGSGMTNPKITGRFFCNKPFVPGLNYPTGLFEPPDAIFQDGQPFPPSDIQDGHNGMTYTYLQSENYDQSVAQFWSTTVPMTYTTTCTYTQPGEYWPLFYADGLSAWYTQKIIVTGTGVTITPNPSPSPSVVTASAVPSAVSNKDLYEAGYTQIGFNQDVQTSVFSQNGMTILNFNPTAKSWDQITSGEYLFEANKAYYVFTPIDKYVDKINLPYSSNNKAIVKSGWNFIWMNDISYLGDILITYKNSAGLCIAQNTPLRFLKEDNMVYKWIYNVVDDKSLTACTAFRLLTGKDQNYTGCSNTNPLLNESSYAKAKSGLWIYVWPGKIENWAKKPAYPCY